MIRRYSELIRLPSFRERFEYLRLGGVVGESTFGFDRCLNQVLYTSQRWKSARDEVIVRDEGCDLAWPDYVIGRKVIVHHMNPLTLADIEEGADAVFDPRYLICVSPTTHNAIHFGDERLLPQPMVERRPGDTCPWRW